MAMSEAMIVGRSLLARRFSTITTAVTVAVAVALMLVLLSMRDSGRRAFERGSGNMHLLVSADLSPMVSVLNSVFYANAPSRALPWTQYLRIEQDPRLSYAIPVQQGDSYMGYPVTATLPEFFTRFSPDPSFDPGAPGRRTAWPLERGRFFERPFEVVAGSQAWRQVGLKVGDLIFLTHGLSGREGAHVHRDHPFEVVGLLDTTGTAHDRALFVHLESAWVVHAQEKLDAEGPGGSPGDRLKPEDLARDDKLITAIYVRGVTREGRATSAVIPTVASELRRNPQLTVASPTDEMVRLIRIVGSVDQILVAMAGVVMVSSGVAIMLALYNSMEQRRRQIAVLRVLGCSAVGIGRMVVMEALAIGLLGAAGGVALSLGGARVVAAVMKERLGLVIEPVIPPDLLTYVVAGALVLAGVAGLVPAVMAYRTSVAKNLKPLG